MTSHLAKKKQRKAKARNEAKKAVAEKAAPVEKGRMELRKDAVQAAVGSLGKPGKYTDASTAKPGQKLVNWSRTTVVEFTGEIRHNPGNLRIGPDKIPGEDLEYMFKMWDDQGNDCVPMGFKPYYPLRDDAADVERIMERFRYKQNLLASRAGAKIKPAEIDEATGQPVPRKQRESKPRGELDPRTGCTPGSDGHSFGEIMLGVKPGENHRKESVEKICKVLGSRMDGPKSKALAQSWYSTLLRKKPEIYGKLRGAAAVKETVEA